MCVRVCTGRSSDDLTTTLVGKHQSTVRHLPGYTGHVPTLRHRFGETYGSATGELVQRPINAKADRKTLNKVRCVAADSLAWHGLYPSARTCVATVVARVVTVSGDGLFLRILCSLVVSPLVVCAVG